MWLNIDSLMIQAESEAKCFEEKGIRKFLNKKSFSVEVALTITYL